ncbi:MAG: hypothetical protein PHQ74_07100 [Crocinitomicaceae bacterium]|nr:hypothetical protein [Crocinitomicaceae bacterium]
MTKKRAIVSYDKLSIDQKRQLEVAFPDGYSEGMTQIKTPTGETLDALLWDTEEVIYLIKLNKPVGKPIKPVDDDDDEEEDDFEEVAVDSKDVEDDVADDEEDDYDKASDDEDDEDEDE